MTKDTDQTADGFEDFPEDDDLTASIRKGLEELKQSQGDDEEFHMDKPLDDATDGAFDVVRAEEAQDMVAKAEIGKDEPKTGDREATKEGDGEGDGEGAEESQPEESADADGGDETGAEDRDAQPDLSAAPIADLVKGMPKRNRGEVTRRLGEAEKLLAPFRGREDELQQHGTTPSEVIGRFLQINEVAMKSPDEYLGWYAQQVGNMGEEAAAKMDAGLKKIAEARGFRIEKADPADDDDPFMSDSEREMRDEMRRLREENQRLKGGGQSPSGAPSALPGDDGRLQAQQILTEMATETNPDGTLKRPEFEQVSPLWAQSVHTFARNNGRPPTREEMSALYDQVAQAYRNTAGGGAGNSAADGGSAAVSRNQDAAKRAAKAQNASKLVDGAGQGASRQPALPEDAPLEDVIKANYGRIFGGNG